CELSVLMDNYKKDKPPWLNFSRAITSKVECFNHVTVYCNLHWFDNEYKLLSNTILV
ncbi:hypothetical protein HN51_054416, partial [Arachis hypogaea]